MKPGEEQRRKTDIYERRKIKMCKKTGIACTENGGWRDGKRAGRFKFKKSFSWL